MKQLLVINFFTALLAFAFSPLAQATTVNVFASEVLATSSATECETTVNTSNCDFVVPGRAIGRDELQATVADADNPDVGTFVFSFFRDEAFIQLGFGDNQVVTGPGADLVIFTVGNGYRFGLTVLDNSADAVELSSFNYSVPLDGSSQAVDENGDRLSLEDENGNAIADISATSIDLIGLADGTEIGSIILFIGNNYNGLLDENNQVIGNDRPLFSAAGAYYTASAVPLPLPAILFGSGIALLGWVARKTHV